MLCFILGLLQEYPFIWGTTAVLTSVMAACMMHYLHVYILFREQPAESGYVFIFTSGWRYNYWISPLLYFSGAIYLAVLDISVLLHPVNGCNNSIVRTPGFGFSFFWTLILAAYIALVWIEFKSYLRIKEQVKEIYDNLVRSAARRD